MAWSRPFDDPIPTPKGETLRTMKDAAAYIMALPKLRVLAELGHSQIQNKPLLNGTIPGQADWTRLRPQRRARRGNPDAVHCLTPSGILDYIGLSVFQRWGRFFDALTVDLAYWTGNDPLCAHI